MMDTIALDDERLGHLLDTAERLAAEWLDVAGGKARLVCGETIWLENVDGAAWEISINAWPIGDKVKTVVAVSLGHGDPIGYLAVGERIMKRAK